VMRKAFGTSAGVIGLLASLTVLGTLLALAAAGLLPGAFPVMVVLGPLFVAQERYWHRRRGRERTTREYRAYEQELA